MTTDWDDLIEQVARDLRDPGHVVWSAEELAGYVERALSAYTRHAPRYHPVDRRIADVGEHRADHDGEDRRDDRRLGRARLHSALDPQRRSGPAG